VRGTPLSTELPLNDLAVFWELSGDLFSVCDSGGRLARVNPAWRRVLGWEPDRVLGRLVTDFMHPDDLGSVGATPADPNGRVDARESRYLCADGSYRWLVWSAFTDGDCWWGVGKDITDRKQAEAARDLAQQRAADACEVTGLSTWWWDPASDRCTLSGELETTRTALDLPANLEGTLQLVQSSHRAEVRHAVTRVVQGLDEHYTIRYPATVATGEGVHWLESRGFAVRDGEGNVVAVQGTTQDVTEAELAHQELSRSHEFDQATLDSLDAHVAVLDAQGTIAFTNRAWTRFASRNGSPGLGVGASYLAVCDAAGDSEPEAGRVAQALRQMLAGSLSRYEIEYPCHSPDEERWFNMRAVLHRSEGPPRVLVQHHDVTQRVLAQRDQRLRAQLLDDVAAAVIATDLEGKITLWSRGAEDLYGWTEEEATGERVLDLTVPAHFHDRMDDFVSHLREHAHWEGGLKLQRKDDSRFIGFLRLSVVCNEEGVPVGVVGICVNATERVQAADDLRKAHDYLAAITDNMGEALVAVDSFGGVLSMNVIAEERLGWASDELLGKNFHEVAHYRRADGSPYPIEECPLMSVRFGGETVRVEEDVFYRRDGSPMPVSYASSPLELAQGETGAVILFSDLTQRKQAEGALARSEKQLKSIIDNTSAAIYVKRRGDYQYTMGNPEFERIVGLAPGTWVGKRDEELHPPEIAQTLRETDRRVIEEGTEITLEEEVLTGGELRTYLTLKFPLPDEHGETYALCGISTDITERKRRQTELEERAAWEARIRSAVSEDRMLIYAQPIIDLSSGAVVQEELLLRMQGDGGPDEIIPPGDFLPQAERLGLVGEIDRYMVQRGIELAAGGRPVEINLSGRSIGDESLTLDIEKHLRATGADPSLIVLRSPRPPPSRTSRLPASSRVGSRGWAASARLRHGLRLADLPAPSRGAVPEDRHLLRARHGRERGRPEGRQEHRQAGPGLRPADRRGGRRG
jgi:PAS domain S-box-containing protein